MKRFTIVAFLSFSLFLLGCSSGGDLLNPDKSVDYLSYLFNAYNSSNVSVLPNDFTAVAVNGDGTSVYLGATNGLYVVSSPETTTPSFVKASDTALANVSINCLLVATSSGNLYIGTNSGGYLRTPGGVLSSLSGLEGLKVKCFADQGDGTMWAGLEDLSASANVVAKSVNGAAFTLIGADKGLPAGTIVCMQADSESVLACASGTANGLYQYGSGKFSAVTDLPFSTGATLFFKSSGTWYVGGSTAGLYYAAIVNGTRKWTSIPSFKDTTPFSFATIAKRFWVATDKGVGASLEFTAWKWYEKGKGINFTNTRAVAGYWAVWFAHPGTTDGGISRGFFNGG